MTSVLEGERHRSGPGPTTGDRVAALTTAVDRSRGRVDAGAVDAAETVAVRASGRMRLSARHTVVAIAGATGSGKSSTFNALTGLDLSAVGVRRPTTSWATACVWGSEDASDVLDWLGIPPRHQTSRDSMLDADREGRELDGVVLLDLPDHDSTEVSHHLEVDRLVGKADLMVWVLDPQKYADAAVHDRYLRPSAAHADTIVVVLNHLDIVPEGRREAMLDDVRRLLADDGLGAVPVIGVSAREGWGVDELRSEVARRVRDKETMRARVDVDVRGAGDRLAEASGLTSGAAAPRELTDARAATLESDLADAAGVPPVLDAVEAAHARRVRRATGWPVVSWVGLLGKDPVARAGLDGPHAGGDAGDDLGRELRGGVPATPTVQRSRADAAVRGVADEVSEGLAPSWRDAVRRAATSRTDALATSLDRDLGGVDLDATRLPAWAQVVRVVQWLLLLAAVGGAVWFGISAAGAAEDVLVGGIALSLVLLVGGLVLGALLGLVSRARVPAAARARRATADERLRGAVHAAASEHVVEPVRAELAAHAELTRALATARA